MEQNDTVLITGGSGLLGYNLNIKNSFKPAKNELNLLNYEDLKKYILNKNIKKIIHCAGLVGGVKANTDLIYDFFSKNLIINLNILEACKEFNLDKSIFILSTCVFPGSGPYPVCENDLHNGEPHITNYGYAYAKRMLEVGSRTLYQQYNIKTKCIIPCNFYGPNDNHNLEYGHVIPSLIYKCYLAKNNKEDFIVWGSGNPQREFIYVKDLAKIIEKIHENENFYPDKIIISSGKEYSIKQIAKLIAEKMNYNGKIIFDKTKPDGIIKKNSNNTIFENNFKKFQWTNIEDGIDESIKYFLSNYPNIRK